jgi:hypothetical protein
MLSVVASQLMKKDHNMRLRWWIECAASLIVAAGSIAFAGEAKKEAAKEEGKDFEAVDYQRRTIYHSPQSPGFTSWVYAWVMPDDSVMVSFYQATGPVEGRERTPEGVMAKIMGPSFPDDPTRDMTGLKSCNVYLRSTDGGATWNKVSEDAFRSPMNGLIVGSAGLRDGTILRAVLGQYLPFDADVPRTTLLQISTDGAKTWGPRTPFLPPDKFVIYPVGIRQLRDGRVAAIGGVSRGTADRPWTEYGQTLEPMLLISNDGGKSWGPPIQVIPDENREGWSCEECDAAELPNGDLFWVFRRCDPAEKDRPLIDRRHIQWQGLIEKRGDSWTPKWVGPSPFPHVGLPNILATHEGVVLQSNVGHWTADAGKTWHSLKLPASAYYPKAVQLADGRILIFAHVGCDDPYGKVDQEIVMDSFRLKARVKSH